MSNQTTSIHVVVFEDRGWWVAQCLEYDLCTSSKNLNDLSRQIASQLRLQVALDRKRGRQPFEGLPPSPEKFWNLYQQATPHAVVKLQGSMLSRILRPLQIPDLQAQLSLAGVNPQQAHL
jgi:hypothetical protein